MEKVSSRLSGWKCQCLSMAARVTLTRAVLSSIPVHSMSTIALLQGTLAKLHKVMRDFVWESSQERKKQHLISWEKVCLPKREGGLGIHLSKEMNISLLAKLGWRLLQNKESLWAKVLRKKYKVGDPHDKAWTSPLVFNMEECLYGAAGYCPSMSHMGTRGQKKHQVLDR